ncbi:MAG: hypothetical protein FWC71_07700 [Defluviitaleaceae bacterium]|nr:hypothetical protein [Defluviitaleaceae bacterium]
MNPYDNRSNGNDPRNDAQRDPYSNPQRDPYNDNDPDNEQECKKILSGAYLRMYRRVLLLGLPLAASVLVGVSLLANFFSPEHNWRIWLMGIRINFGGGPVAVVANVVLGLVVMFGIITVIFVLLQKFNVDIGEYGKYDADSPNRNYIGPAGPIGEILLSLATTTLFLGTPFLMAGRFDGEWVSVFSTSALRAMWLPIIAWMTFEIISEVTKLIDRKYTTRVCVITVLCGIACALSAFYVFNDLNIINPEFLYHMVEFNYTVGTPEWVVEHIVMQPNRIPLGIMLSVIFFEVVDVIYYTAKFRIFQDEGDSYAS